MSLLLFLDTTYNSCRVFLANESEILYALEDSRSLRHSHKLLPAIDHILKITNMTLDKIEYFAAPLGPGSFTGVRIALATAKSFCFALDKKFITINNLEMQAYPLNFLYNDAIVYSLMNAGNEMYYYSVFKTTCNDLECKISNKLINSLNLFEMIETAQKKIIIADKKTFNELKTKCADKKIDIINADVLLTNENIRTIIFDKARRAEFDNPVTAAPIYIKKTDAEYLKLTKK